MLLGTRNITQGDTRRVVVDYSEFLAQGAILASETVIMSSGATSTVQNATLSENKKMLIFFVTAGALNENFTVSVQITDSQGETVNDTINFTVVAH